LQHLPMMEEMDEGMRGSAGRSSRIVINVI